MFAAEFGVEPLNRALSDVAQASSPASSPGVPSVVRAGSRDAAATRSERWDGLRYAKGRAGRSYGWRDQVPPAWGRPPGVDMAGQSAANKYCRRA